MEGGDMPEVEQLELRDYAALLGQLVQVLDETPGVSEHVVAEVDGSAGQRAGVRPRVENREPGVEGVSDRTAGGQLDDQVGRGAQRRDRVLEPTDIKGGPGLV